MVFGLDDPLEDVECDMLKSANNCQHYNIENC